jgi:hypothetical protein
LTGERAAKYDQGKELVSLLGHRFDAQWGTPLLEFAEACFANRTPWTILHL